MAEDPFAGDDIGVRWTRDQLLGSIADERLKLLLHGGEPVRVLDGGVYGTRQRGGVCRGRRGGDVGVLGIGLEDVVLSTSDHAPNRW